MGDRLLVDIDAGGRASFSTDFDDETIGADGAPVDLTAPIGADELADLRWYFEDYLRAPFGVYEDRGARVESRIPVWGRAMFAALFGSGPGRDAYVRLRMRGQAAELAVRSADPGWLALPWELLRDPALPTPLALDGMVLSRGLLAGNQDSLDVGGQRLRVLMVISRPGGADDVGYRMIARPLLHRLAAVRRRVEVEVLRPPTLDALAERLRTGEFQVVHFDGHGVATGDEAALVFERAGGGVEYVPAGRFAQVLADAHVPVAVLNACRSGAVGKQVEAAVATRLLAAGADAVIAMAYNVYAVAAAEFMTAFYAALFAGETVGDAVGAGRARLAARPDRPSPKGPLPLADWSVPVYYRRRVVRFPDLRRDPEVAASMDEQLDMLRAPEHGDPDDPFAADGPFIGRDDVFHKLESGAGRMVLLHGPAGTGKTELAKAFGRWWRDTGGVDRPEWVLWHSFRPGVASFGLDGVLSAIGLAVFGPSFAVHDTDSRREQVHTLLRDNRLLLVWDNVESIVSLPDPASPPLDEAGRTELVEFLHRVAAEGRSTILLTSRTPEDWLGAVRRVPVGSLAPDEAIQYADHLLAPLPAATARRADRAFGELLTALDGHPLSMRLLLPHLETTAAAELLAALRGTGPSPEERLTTGLAYSMAHLDPADRDLLAAVSLVDGVVSATTLGLVFSLPDAPDRFRGLAIEQWTALFDRATRVGLLAALGNGWYRIHPALPAHLAERWEPSERAAAERSFLDAFVALSAWLAKRTQGADAPQAYKLIEVQQSTMVRLLGYALDHGLWTQVNAIAFALTAFWDRRGSSAEVAGWMDRILRAVEAAGGPPPLDQPSGALWLMVMDSMSDRMIRARDLDAAQSLCLRVEQALRAHPEMRASRGTLCVRLGAIASVRARWDEAETWFRESLALAEEADDKTGQAATYRELGDVARARGRWDEAQNWYGKSLKLKRLLGDRRNEALTLTALGNLEEVRKQWTKARDWYRQALDISRDLGDEDGTARAAHHLGATCERLGELDAAEQWYRLSLGIAERMGDPIARGASYTQLGKLALHRENLDEAEQWFHRDREIVEPLHDLARMAVTYQLLGCLELKRKHYDKAEPWLSKSLAAFTEVDDPQNIAVCLHLLGQLKQVAGRPDEAAASYRTSLAQAEALGDKIAIAFNRGMLGHLAGARGDLGGALDWTLRAIAEIGDVETMRDGLVRAQVVPLVRRLGLGVVEREWRRIVGGALPEQVRAAADQEQEDHQ